MTRCNARAFKVKRLPSLPPVLQQASRGWLAGALDLIPSPRGQRAILAGTRDQAQEMQVLGLDRL